MAIISDISVNETKIQDIIEKCICLYSYEKPLKAISNFKMDELSALAVKIGIEVHEKIPKNELYGIIARKWYLVKLNNKYKYYI